MIFFFDFETEPIQEGRGFPKPVLLAWAEDGGAVHVSPPGDMREIIRTLFQSPVCGHNVAFDIGVAVQHFHVEPPRDVHDTMIREFLIDPYKRSLALKDVARDRGFSVTAVDALKADIYARVKGPGGKPVRGERAWAQHIHEASPAVLARYAKEDVRLTRALFHAQEKEIPARAYAVERQMPRLMAQMQLDGLRLDRAALLTGRDRWGAEQAALETWLAQQVGMEPADLNRAKSLMDAFVRKGWLSAPLLTEKGRPMTRWDVLQEQPGIPKPWLVAWRARQQRQKLLKTFVLPWLSMLDDYDDRIHCSWYSTRGGDTDAGWGARTGRMACSPNLMNIPKRKGAPDKAPVKLTEMNLRELIRPAPGHVFLQRDYSQQELRILAHYEDAQLLSAYTENPRLDMHSWAQEMIQRKARLKLPRDAVKTTGFSIMYGSGVKGVSKRLRVSEARGRRIRDAYLQAIPGIKRVQDRLRRDEHKKPAFRTWGGRPYNMETVHVPLDEFGTTESFSYGHKLLNYLIQGSAADCTKHALIAYDARRQHGKLVCAVHDELLVEVPIEYAETEMQILKECMESVEFKLPMVTDGVICRKHFGEAQK